MIFKLQTKKNKDVLIILIYICIFDLSQKLNDKMYIFNYQLFVQCEGIRQRKSHTCVKHAIRLIMIPVIIKRWNTESTEQNHHRLLSTRITIYCPFLCDQLYIREMSGGCRKRPQAFSNPKAFLILLYSHLAQNNFIFFFPFDAGLPHQP